MRGATRRLLVLAAVLAAVLMPLPSVGRAQGAPPGAASCSGCHSPGGRAASALPVIHGRDAADLVGMLEAFRSGERPATLMNRIVKGFSPEEVRAIAAWLSAHGEG